MQDLGMCMGIQCLHSSGSFPLFCDSSVWFTLTIILWQQNGTATFNLISASHFKRAIKKSQRIRTGLISVKLYCPRNSSHLSHQIYDDHNAISIKIRVLCIRKESVLRNNMASIFYKNISPKKAFCLRFTVIR